MEERLTKLEQEVEFLELLFKSLNEVLSSFVRTECEFLSKRFEKEDLK